MRLPRLFSLRPRANPAGEQLVAELYRGLLGREPDAGGLRTYAAALGAGMPLAELVRGFVASEEFKQKQGYLRVAPVLLPNLIERHPQRYRRNEDGSSTLRIDDDADFDGLERMIHEHRYYDSFGVWSPVIDIDKRVIAALVAGTGARRCLEIGCFTGPVLSLLDAEGIDVAGVEVSHLAFVLAYASIRSRIHYGDLLTVELPGRFDAILAMDILEHLNPLKLDRYIARLAASLERDGYFLLNSPMFGSDDVFGEVAPAFLPEWRSAGPDTFWRHMHCDEKGWPMHGHLIWASPAWWERQMAAHGLVRDRTLERRVHADLEGFFAQLAPARKSFFLLRHADATPSDSALADRVSAALKRALATEPALARNA